MGIEQRGIDIVRADLVWYCADVSDAALPAVNCGIFDDMLLGNHEADVTRASMVAVTYGKPVRHIKISIIQFSRCA